MYMSAISHIMKSMRKMVMCASFLTITDPSFYSLGECEDITLVYCLFVHAEHFNPLLEQIGKLEEALYNIQFEQHWLEAQTERQAIGT